MPKALADRVFGGIIAIFVYVFILVGCGCGSGHQSIAKSHWKADTDGQIRVTFRFPTAELATDKENKPNPLASEFPESWKAITRTRFKDWEAAARADGIPLTVTEVPPSDRAAKVDFIVASLPGKFAGTCDPYHSNMARGEIGRMLVTLRPGLTEELVSGTVAHEQGHALGLPEIDNRMALMNPNRPNETITGSDTAELVRHYPPISPL